MSWIKVFFGQVLGCRGLGAARVAVQGPFDEVTALAQLVASASVSGQRHVLGQTNIKFALYHEEQ